MLACVDGTQDGDRALRYAVKEARRRGTGLRIVHVEGPSVVSPPMVALAPVSTLHEVAAGIVKDAEAQARRLGWTDPDLEVIQTGGPRRDAILDFATDAVCIVLGRRSSAIDHLLTGSTTTAVAAHAAVPVISVPEQWDPSGDPAGWVVVGVEGRQALSSLLTMAMAEARSRKARLEVLHAWRPTGVYDVAVGQHVVASGWRAQTRDLLTERVHDLRRDADDQVEWTVTAEYDRPTVALVNASERADLVVLGSARPPHPAAPGAGIDDPDRASCCALPGHGGAPSAAPRVRPAMSAAGRVGTSGCALVLVLGAARAVHVYGWSDACWLVAAMAALGSTVVVGAHSIHPMRTVTMLRATMAWSLIILSLAGWRHAGARGALVLVVLLLVLAFAATGTLLRRRRDARTAASASPTGTRADSPATAASVKPPPSEVPPIALSVPDELEADDLCRAWRSSYLGLEAAGSVDSLLRAVHVRRLLLDELERVDPAAFHAWLRSRPRAAEDPERHFRRPSVLEG